MARTLGYPDALRLLGADDPRVTAVIERITGGALLAGAATGSPQLLALLDARGELVALAHAVLRRVAERDGGLSRHTRTRRLRAALEVVAVTAFFEALDAAPLPFRLADLELTTADRVALTGGPRPPADAAPPAAVLLATGAVPGAGYLPSGAEADALLAGRYRLTATAVSELLRGLAVWDGLAGHERDRARAALDGVPDRAVERYRELVRQLAQDCPEVAFWTGQVEHDATRHAVARLGDDVRAGLAGLGEALAAIASGSAPDAVRTGLARVQRAALTRAVIAAGDRPPGLELPTLGEAYQPPAFRAVHVTGTDAGALQDRLSDEAWWSGLPVRDDLTGLLGRYLTSPEATRAPLLVLGQPGSGKSLLTTVLVGQLPPADFLAVRVLLRDVRADADLDEQVRHGVRAATGEDVTWPQLARSAGDAQPVLVLDGFDELLQATGLGQSDYLLRVAAFQQREAEAGRPVAVAVTTRTSVANRATAPEGTVALRLEPFDAARVTAWLAVWNRVNAGYFAGRGLRPLDAATALAHPALAAQPLLLLMLALYDADGNPLQGAGAELSEGALYGRLLARFAEREVRRDHPGLADVELRHLVEVELRRLAVVAFGAFNRGAQWIAEDELERDLHALVAVPPAAAPGARLPLRAAELLLGRFFFVHRARASLGAEQRRETYEFLHATFAEYLVARFTWDALADVRDRERASRFGLGGGAPADDDLLHALLSFVSLCGRAPVLAFLREFAAGTPAADLAGLHAVALRLFHAAHVPDARPRGFGGYRPAPLAPAARQAAYTANLLLLTVCTADRVAAGTLFPGAPDPVGAWQDATLLWRSQTLHGGWTSLVDALAIERTWAGDHRDLWLSLDDGTYAAPPADLDWSFRRPRDSAGAVTLGHLAAGPLRRKAFALSKERDDLVLHALAPVLDLAPDAVSTLVATDLGTRSVAHLLLAVVLPPPDGTPAERGAAYERLVRACLAVGATAFPDLIGVALDRLAADPLVPEEQVEGVLLLLAGPGHPGQWPMFGPLVRCGLTHALRSPALAAATAEAASRLGTVTQDSRHLMPDVAADTVALAEALSTTRVQRLPVAILRALADTAWNLRPVVVGQPDLGGSSPVIS